MPKTSNTSSSSAPTETKAPAHVPVFNHTGHMIEVGLYDKDFETDSRELEERMRLAHEANRK
jgi:hypothetical protein